MIALDECFSTLAIFWSFCFFIFIEAMVLAAYSECLNARSHLLYGHCHVFKNLISILLLGNKWDSKCGIPPYNV